MSVDSSSVSVQNVSTSFQSDMSRNVGHAYDVSINESSSSSSYSPFASPSDSMSPSSTSSPPQLYSTSKDVYSSDAANLSVLIEQKLQSMVNPRAIDDSSLIALLIAYTILILLGVTGNGLVCAAVIRKPSMRTGRNVYIINLAISDLLLCIFTMPFTLVDIALKYWPLGECVSLPSIQLSPSLSPSFKVSWHLSSSLAATSTLSPLFFFSFARTSSFRCLLRHLIASHPTSHRTSVLLLFFFNQLLSTWLFNSGPLPSDLHPSFTPTLSPTVMHLMRRWKERRLLLKKSTRWPFHMTGEVSSVTRQCLPPHATVISTSLPLYFIVTYEANIFSQWNRYLFIRLLCPVNWLFVLFNLFSSVLALSLFAWLPRLCVDDSRALHVSLTFIHTSSSSFYFARG